MDDLISRKKLLEQTAEWEASALEQVGKLDPRNGPEEREEWIKWSYILRERSAFRVDVETAPAVNQKTGKWIEEDRQNPHWYSWIHCSECGRQDIDAPASRTPYCPNCGARMENSNG